MNKDLYLVRHGQTIFNLKRIIQGWSDSPLTQLGCDQAARAGMFLRARGIEPDHAYTSTLHRTEQTIANLWPGLAYERLDGLREWFFGDFEAERVMLMPERPWRDFYRQFGGEGQMQVRERMVTTLTELMRRPDHECVLAVSHGSAIKEFLDHVRGAAADERERVPGNCSVLHFVFDDTTDTFELVEIFTQEDYARELGLEPLVAARVRSAGSLGVAVRVADLLARCERGRRCMRWRCISAPFFVELPSLCAGRLGSVITVRSGE